MKATEKAYIAGLFDGEGSIYIRIKGDRLQLEVNISQHMGSISVLEMVQNRFSGSISSPYKNNCKWVTSHDKAKKFLLKMLPYLHIKKEQARIAIAFCVVKNAVTKWRFRIMDGNDLRNGKGIAIPDEIRQFCNKCKRMITELNNFLPVTETERESLQEERRFLSQKYDVMAGMKLSFWKDATVQPTEMINQ